MINRLSQKMVSGVLALAVALTLGVVAYAGVEQKVSFYLDGKVGTETIKKGEYKIVIPEAEQGTVEIKVGKKTIAAQSARTPTTPTPTR